MLINNLGQLEKLVEPYKVYNRNSFTGLNSFSLDSRSLKPKQVFVALKGKLCDGHDFIAEAVSRGAACIIAEKYLPTTAKVPFLLVKDSYRCLRVLVKYLRTVKKPFVYAITGSLGKTTTKEILYFLLKDSCSVLKNPKTENNILGVAKTFFSLTNQKVLITELGTNQKGEIGTLSKMILPDVGVITFIKPVHLEGLGSLKDIFREKLSLRLANRNMKLVLNRDDAYLKKVKPNNKVYWFGTSSKNNIFACCLERNKVNSRFLIQNKYELRLKRYQEGFITNILAAILSGQVYGIPLEYLVNRAKKFKAFPSMRMQIHQLKKFLVVNDAYNASPYAIKTALSNFKDHPLKKIAVIGDMLELGKKSNYYHRQLAGHIIKNKFSYCLTIGLSSHELNRSLIKLGYQGAFHFDSHQKLANFICKNIASAKNGSSRYLVFLKGSRKIKLEKIIPYLK